MKSPMCARQLDSLITRPIYACPSCRIACRPRKRVRTERFASTSTTAINGTRPIPTRNRQLYDALTEVKSTASAHVNLSRLQLALQGLESTTPTTRIAILGLNVQDTARRIARLLLADALEDEHTWEKQILEQHGAQGILLRYGQPQNSNIPQRSTLPILQIPSPILEKLNVELLVASINAETINGTDVPAEAFLAPAVGVPTAFDGRQVTVNQPVHQTLLVAYGFDELVRSIELFSATKFKSEEDKNAVMLVANLSGNGTTSTGQVLVSDVARAEKGINAIRESTSKATTYEHEWLASGMPELSEWLTEHSKSSGSSTLAAPVNNLISSLLTATSNSLQTSTITARKLVLPGMDRTTYTRIESAIEDFSRAAHQELQSGLASAWSSRNWRKLSWYKLFWRVDDVGLIISDLVTNTWLPKTERAVYEISGRLTQIGISPVMSTAEIPPTQHTTAFEPGLEPETAQATILDPVPPLVAAATTAPSNEIVLNEPTQAVITISPTTDRAIIDLQPAPRAVPITTVISNARSNHLLSQITSLTTTAQQLVLRTLSISGLSGGLSGLVYVSSIAPTIYEAGTIFAVGTVFALYRMQTGWQVATKNLERGLFEEGRDVVRRVVQRLRDLVERKGAEVSGGDPVEMKMLEDAQRAVDRAKMALQDLKRKGEGQVRK